MYFSPELQDPQCPWFLVESRRVDRALFEWQDKEAKICGKSKQTPAECKASSRSVLCRTLKGRGPEDRETWWRLGEHLWVDLLW